MTIEYRELQANDLQAFFTAEDSAYTTAPSAESRKAYIEAFEYERSLAAFDGQQIVGGACYYRMDLSVPGGAVPAGPVTFVFVIPSHRRQGIVTELMRRQLEQMRSEGMAVGVLHAAESSIYGRFGYGSAAPTEVLEIEKHYAALASPARPAGKFRLLDDDEAMQSLPPVYEAYRRTTPGLLSRDSAWWKLRLRNGSSAAGSPDWFKVIYERDGSGCAYVIYKAEGGWQNALPQNKLNIIEMAATDAESYAATWQYIFGIDLVRSISAYASANPPIWWMLTDPRRLMRRTRDGLWVRLLDVTAALAGRKYMVDGTVTLEVTDSFCPWNSGVYTVSSVNGDSTCELSGDSPEITVSASALASRYLGSNDFHTLAAAGLAQEHSPGALTRATAMFGWHVQPMTSVPDPLS